MANKLNKKQCWKKVRIQMGEGFIEVAERKVLATIGMALLFLWYFGTYALLLLGMTMSGGLDITVLLVMGIVQGIPLVLAMCFYRPPRVLRLFPEERIAQVYRTFLGIKMGSRWEDLSGGAVVTRRILVNVRQATDREGGGAAALGCFFALLGPIGILLSFFLLREKREIREPAYAVTAAGVHSHLALLLRQSEADHIVSLYEAVQFNSASDLLSGD